MTNGKKPQVATQPYLITMEDVVTSSTYNQRKVGKPKAEQVKRDPFPQKYEHNPDQLLVDRHKDLSLYKRMMMDGTVNTAISLRKEIALSVAWHVDAPQDDEIAQEQAEFACQVFDNLQTVPFIDVLDSLLDSEWLGFRIAERKWSKQNGRWIYADIKCKDSEDFDFQVDDYGNLEYVLFGFTQQKIDPADVIVAVSPYVDNGNYYGTSCLQSIYTDWFAKTTITKYRNVYLQNRSSAPFQAIYNATSSTAKEAAAKIANSIQNDYWATIPAGKGLDGKLQPDVEIKLMDIASGSGTGDFDNAISQLDRSLMRGLMVPDNLGFSDTTSGSYAQSKTQLRSVLYGVQKRLDRLASIVNSQILRPLLEINFGYVADGVAFMFEDIDDDVSEARSIVIDRLVKAGIVDANEEFVREYLNIPERKDDDMPEMPDTVPQAGPTMQEGRRYMRDMDFEEIAFTMSSIDNMMVEEIGEVFTKATPKLIGYIQKKVLIPNDLSAVQALRFDGVGEIRDSLIRGMYQAYLSGKRDCAKDIKQYSKKDVIQFSEDQRDVIMLAEKSLNKIDFKKLGLTGIDAWLEQYGSKLSAADKEALRTISQKAFQIAGDDIANQLLLDIRKTIKSGLGVRTTEQIVQDVEAQIGKYVNTALTDPDVPDQSVVGALELDEPVGRIKTIVRNATTTTYNQGLVAQALDPRLKGFVQWAQYVAILDDVTTPFCRAHDGEVVEVGSPDFITLTPPNHHNCRSTWIFGFRGDDWDVNWNDKKDSTLDKIGISRNEYTNGVKGFGKRG